ncbi:MAG: iron-sulfur cluster assembly scaffold protein [Planctomycetes bacterium]|nr:iron-sulfur cluster assembly scaffold protein [Planctomycetota bacterium]
MVSPQLKQVMLAAEHAGELSGADVRRGAAEHPVCGDRVELSLRTDGECITAVRWRAVGCPAAMAVAALAARALVGASGANAAATLRAALAAHGDLAPHERHAEALVGRALRAAGL